MTDFMAGKTQMIAYIGKKPVKRDTVAGTGIIWGGFGDVQEVPHKAAVKLLQHPDVWCVESKLGSQEPKSPGLGSVDKSDGEDQDQEQDQGSQDSEPEGSTERDNVIANAILSLSHGDPEHFGSTGNPVIAAVREAAGDETITVKEVNAVWRELNK